MRVSNFPFPYGNTGGNLEKNSLESCQQKKAETFMA